MQDLTPVELFHKSYGTGQPLVILHGLLGSSDNWHGLSQRVFARHFHVLVPDLRNHGRSPHSEVFNYPTMVEDLRYFFQEQGLSPAHLMGHSMGGKTAMLFALTYPSKVQKLIVVDIAPKVYPAQHLKILTALRSLDLKSYDSKKEIDEALKNQIPSNLIRQFLLKNVTHEEGRYRWRINLESLYHNYEELNAALETDRVFDGPALFVRGSQSDYIMDTDYEGIRRLFPNARSAVVDPAGHWVHFDQPEGFARAVLDFLSPTASL